MQLPLVRSFVVLMRCAALLHFACSISNPSSRSYMNAAVWVQTVRKTTCMILDDGIVRCFGDTSTATNRQMVPSGLKARKLSIGPTSVCAIALNGTLVCWGTNTFVPF